MISSREATVQDIDLIRDIARNTWFETYREMLSQEQMDYMFDLMYSKESINRQMTELGHHFYLAYDQKGALGYVSVQQQKEDLFHLHKLYILPAGQGKGVGKTLINIAFSFAKNKAMGKACALELNMNRDNKARFFYEKMGMRISEIGDFDIGNGYYMNDYIFRIDFPGL